MSERYEDDDDNQGDASSKKALGDKTKNANRIQNNCDMAMKDILSSANGRSWMWSLLEKCNMYCTSFSGTAERTYFNEGMRNIGLMVTADILRLAPDQYINMLKENGDKT